MSGLDLGNYFAQLLLEAAAASINSYDLPPAGISQQITGSTLPIADCCQGLLWTRVDTVYPTSGDGQPFMQARPGFDIPAWCFPVQVGWLGCHQNVTEDGAFVDPTIETTLANRDGQYRSAIIAAVSDLLPDAGAPCLLGYRLSPWTPYGPDGMCSGGMMIVYCIAGSLTTDTQP